MKILTTSERTTRYTKLVQTAGEFRSTVQELIEDAVLVYTDSNADMAKAIEDGLNLFNATFDLLADASEQGAKVGGIAVYVGYSKSLVNITLNEKKNAFVFDKAGSKKKDVKQGKLRTGVDTSNIGLWHKWEAVKPTEAEIQALGEIIVIESLTKIQDNKLGAKKPVTDQAQEFANLVLSEAKRIQAERTAERAEIIAQAKAEQKESAIAEKAKKQETASKKKVTKKVAKKVA